MESVIILDASAARRDRIRSQVNAIGYSALCFDRVNSLLDNFISLSPNLLIIGNVSLREQQRAAYAVKSFNHRFPILFFRPPSDALFPFDSNFMENIARIEDPDSTEALAEQLAYLIGSSGPPGEEQSHPMLIGESLETQKIRKRIHAIGSSMESVFIIGEKGTGKDLVARSVQWHNRQENRGIVRCSIPAFLAKNEKPPADMLPSQIMALRPEPAATETDRKAHRRWTLLIDGIDQMPGDHQTSFFQFLTEGEGHRLFNNDNHLPRVRIISIAEKDLSVLMMRGLFRKDLYHLLSVFTIQIPPLRQRPDDIEPLSDFFCDYYSLRLSKTCLEISDNAMARMKTYAWPGNVAELKSLMTALVKAGDEAFLSDYFATAGRSLPRTENTCKQFQNESAAPVLENGFGGNDFILSLKPACKQVIKKTEKIMILEALERTNWNRRKAAALLEISYRSLLSKIKAYELSS